MMTPVKTSQKRSPSSPAPPAPDGGSPHAALPLARHPAGCAGPAKARCRPNYSKSSADLELGRKNNP